MGVMSNAKGVEGCCGARVFNGLAKFNDFLLFYTFSYDFLLIMTELAVHSATELTQVLVVVVIVSLNSFRPGASPTLDQAGTFPV